MPISVRCTCGRVLTAPETLGGRKGRCSGCGAVLSIPAVPSRWTAQFIFPAQGPIALSPEGGWVINPDTTFPLTILGIDQAAALELRSLLDGTATPQPLDPCARVAATVARTGLRCKEIDDYVARYGADFQAGREPEVVPYCDAELLFRGQRLDPATNRELARRYGFENLCVYARYALGQPRPIPPTHPDREAFDGLARAGLATVGPPMARAGIAGDAFTLLPFPAGPGLGNDLALWIGYCHTIADLIAHTYAHAQAAARAATDPAIGGILRGYGIATVGDGRTCRFCARQEGQRFPPDERPRVPLHVGCRCTVMEIFD